jgi:uncharacterized membrane protein
VVACVGFGLGFTLTGGFFARSGPHPWRDATLSSCAAFGVVTVAWFRDPARFLEQPARWWAIALAAAAILAAFARESLARRDELAGGSRTGSVFVVGAGALAALAGLFDLPDWLLPPMFATLAIVQVAVHHAFPHRTTRVAGIVFATLAAALAWILRGNPGWDGGTVRSVVGHVLAATALVVAAWRARGKEDRSLEAIVAACAAVAGGALLAFAIREMFVADAFPRTLEWGVLTTVGIAYGLTLREAARRFAVPMLHLVGDAVAATSVFVGAQILTVPHNPMLTRWDVGGTPVWNAILPAYGGPCAATILAARLWRRRGALRPLVVGAGILATWFAFLGVTLSVRQAFRGGVLSLGRAGDAEVYAYSVAWIVLSLVLLVVARRTGGRLPAVASAVVLGIAVVKVFLFDTGNLTGLYRVASLFGLGLTLLGLAYVYQRWVFVGGSGGAGPPEAQVSNRSGSQRNSSRDGGAM